MIQYTYDTYSNLESHTGTSTTPFLYNGRDGVMTDSNGLYYLRSRYYSPELMRFINADTLKGTIASGVTLSRYAYANGNPVSFVDPFGTSAEPGNVTWDNVHTLLDAAGMIPGFGMAFDAINGVWYLIEGDCTNAGFSAFAFIPIVGDIGQSGRLEYKAINYLDEVAEGADFYVGPNGIVAKNLDEYDWYTKGSNVGNPVEVAGNGQTGRVLPSNLNEQMAMEQVKSNPLLNAEELPLKLGDERWPSEDGWVKMQSVVKDSNGNNITGAFDDFKFK